MVSLKYQGLKGKKVLFLTWPFYQYPIKIENKLIELGAEVKTYFSSPTNNFLITRFMERFSDFKRKYYKRILKEISEKDFDYIFVINAAIFPEYFFKELFKIQEKAYKILYSWDSIAVYPAAINMHKYFDRIYSFDSKDVENNKYMIFLPLFFCDDLYSDNNKFLIKYDFSFIGFGHTERYKFIKQIEKQSQKNNWSYYFKLYLPSSLHFFIGKYIKKIFPEAQKNDFIYKPLKLQEIQNIANESKIIVDLELSNQSGLTMRTIETLGMRKKLITTNKNIKNYDFYNENNILVVDRSNPVISEKFVENAYVFLDDKIYDKYTLTNWLKMIFQVD